MAKKESFSQPISPKKRESSRFFAAPTKEQATTGRYMDAGDSYGVGHRQPVGRVGSPKEGAAVLPMKSKCFEPSL